MIVTGLGRPEPTPRLSSITPSPHGSRSSREEILTDPVDLSTEPVPQISQPNLSIQSLLRRYPPNLSRLLLDFGRMARRASATTAIPYKQPKSVDSFTIPLHEAGKQTDIAQEPPWNGVEPSRRPKSRAAPAWTEGRGQRERKDGRGDRGWQARAERWESRKSGQDRASAARRGGSPRKGKAHRKMAAGR
jgi:hypothetical protein